MRLFKTNETEPSTADAAAAERLQAIASRFKTERSTYSRFEPAPEPTAAADNPNDDANRVDLTQDAAADDLIEDAAVAEPTEEDGTVAWTEYAAAAESTEEAAAAESTEEAAASEPSEDTAAIEPGDDAAADPSEGSEAPSGWPSQD